MERTAIEPYHFLEKPFHLWNKQTLVLTSGDYHQGVYNAMTVGWGSLGIMWNRPFAQIVVRPSRYTYEFLEKYDTFTLCAFPEVYHHAVQLIGTKSGRDLDKIKEAGITPIASSKIAAPGFAEAELILECRKIYWSDLESSHFLDEDIMRQYPKSDFHRVYFGEILAVSGTETFQR